MPLPISLLLISLVARPDYLRADMNMSANPSVDFFTYANGGWLSRHPIPASESGWGIGNEVELEIYARLRSIDEKAAKTSAARGSDLQKIGDFWSTAMDQEKSERLGLSPLKPELDRIAAVDSVAAAVKEGFRLQRLGVDSFFSFYVGQDEKDSDANAIHLDQGGLGLPERDFYFNPEAGVAKIRTEYVAYIRGLLGLVGETDPASSADAVMAFETTLAKASRKLEDTRDPETNYHRLRLADLDKLAPSIDWERNLAGRKLRPTSVIVGQPEFYSALSQALEGTALSTIRAYLAFHLIDEYAPYLNRAADALNFHFEHQVLSGQQEPQPRWKRALRAEGHAIGFILGRQYVRLYLGPAEKKRYSDLVEAFRRAYGRRIDRLTWMSSATKAKARHKLAALRKKVGYPDHWKDYSTLVISRASYCGNMMSAAEWQFDDMDRKYGKPVDRTEWMMPPQTYNAYYDTSNNEIVLPAVAFDIPGVKSSRVDDAVLYGYAGASTIGHEMTHGFDDEGRKFDAKGNLKDWWTKEDAARFEKRASVMIKQFDNYEPLPGLHINGRACLGENIADFGGVLIGLDAFKRTKQYREGKRIAGLTPLQRFFLGYALSWMEKSRPEALRRQLLGDVHAPAKYRVIGPLSNVPDFYEAFGIKPGSAMWRPAKDRVQIW